MFACVHVYLCVHDPKRLVSNEWIKSILRLLSLLGWTSSFITTPALPWVQSHAATDKHLQHLSYWQKHWEAITSQKTTKITANKCYWDVRPCPLRAKEGMSKKEKRRITESEGKRHFKWCYLTEKRFYCSFKWRGRMKIWKKL